MNQLFVLIPDLNLTQEIALQLKDEGIKQSNIHIIGNRSDWLKRAHLPEANIIQTSDLIPSLKRGVLIGSIGGIILCLLYIYALPAQVKMNIFIAIAIVVFSLIFGAWVSSLIGVSVENPLVEKYRSYVKKGHYIMIIDLGSELELKAVQNLLAQYNLVKVIEDKVLTT